MFQRVLHYILIRNLAGKELTDEKIYDFKRLTLLQGAIILSLFLLDLFTYLAFPYHIELAESIFFLLLGVYVFLLWDMLRNYTSSKTIILLNFIFIMGVFLIGLVVVNPFMHMEAEPPYRIFLACIMVCLLAVECTVIYFTLMEFFKKDLCMPMRLWGAACIYLMIGLAFGNVYENCVRTGDSMYGNRNSLTDHGFDETDRIQFDGIEWYG
ncbi:MAG: hypothetical protein AABY93_08255 [Bacteroidota bacterium]